jgi:hypothetical protein
MPRHTSFDASLAGKYSIAELLNIAGALPNYIDAVVKFIPGVFRKGRLSDRT